MRRQLFLFLFSISIGAIAQNDIRGKVHSDGEPLPFANVYLEGTQMGTISNEEGTYLLSRVPEGSYRLSASFAGFSKKTQSIEVYNSPLLVNFDLEPDSSLDEIVISGTLKPVIRKESSVPVEVYTPTFLKKIPLPRFLMPCKR